MKTYLRLFYDYGGGGNIAYNTPANTAGAGLANNGLSVAGGKVQLGGVDGAASAANLLNNREIPMNGFSLKFSGISNPVGSNQIIFQNATNTGLVPQFIFTNGSGTEIGRIRFSPVPGNNSVFIGAGAGGTNSGAANVALGVNALNSNVSGIRNTAIGAGAAQFNSTNFNNCIIIGLDSLDNGAAATGDQNIVIGNNVLDLGFTTGNANVFIGNGNNNSNGGNVGDANVVIGNNSNVGGTLTNTCLILGGNGATPLNLSNLFVLGNNTHNYVFGITPASYIDNGSKMQIYGSLSLPISVSAVGTTLTNANFTVIYTAASTATLPTAASSVGRIYCIVAAGAAFNVTTSINYNNLSNASVNTIAAPGSAMIQSDGTTWRQIK